MFIMNILIKLYVYFDQTKKLLEKDNYVRSIT
ncbi:hypothetical protein M2114_000234 [Aurantimicrobium minutum]|nr:hypothetical protein [Aurantimicrobium minutum]MDH6409922.1 hypothetical protein [Aurantimicrobium minutum]MDH6424117.1 hypothetical protein [Aurantimicrobium minutum]